MVTNTYNIIRPVQMHISMRYFLFECVSVCHNTAKYCGGPCLVQDFAFIQTFLTVKESATGHHELLRIMGICRVNDQQGHRQTGVKVKIGG